MAGSARATAVLLQKRVTRLSQPGFHSRHGLPLNEPPGRLGKRILSEHFPAKDPLHIRRTEKTTPREPPSTGKICYISTEMLRAVLELPQPAIGVIVQNRESAK